MALLPPYTQSVDYLFWGYVMLHLNRFIHVVFASILMLTFSLHCSAQSIRADMTAMIKESQDAMAMLHQWESDNVKQRLTHRLEENTLMMGLWLELEARDVFKDESQVYLDKAAELMTHQTGLLYVTYQILDFAESQRIPFDFVLKKYPPLANDLYAALDKPVSVKQAKNLFDRWLYMGLVTRYASR